MIRPILLLLLSALLITLYSCKDHDHPHGEGHGHEIHEHGNHDGHNQAKGSGYKRTNIDYKARLDSLGIELTAPGAPVANYVNIRQAGKVLYLAGKGPRKPDGTNITGQVGTDLTIEQGYEAAKWAAIAQLSVLQDHLGDLNRVKQILKVTGMVNAAPGFGNQPEVVNGYSDTMVAVFGERGKHARAAVGMGSLPRNIAVEVDMVVEIY